MYDPSIGRWLEEDPIGFKAGDADLYRYVGNSPTDAIDPSGLEGERIKELIFTWNRPFFSDPFTTAEAKTIMDGTWAAIDRIEKAYIMLKDHWDDLKELSTFKAANGKIIISSRYKKLAEEEYKDVVSTAAMWECAGSMDIVFTRSAREQYLLLIQRVLRPIRNKDSIEFKPDRSPPSQNGRRAYVVYTLGVPGSTIHITNAFFSAPRDQQIDVIVHELGRRIGFGAENTGNLFKDVYEWDLTIDFLAQKYDELMRKKK